MAPSDDLGEESPPASALSTPQFSSTQQEIPASSLSFFSEEDSIYCLSPEPIAYRSPDTRLSLYAGQPIIDNLTLRSPTVPDPEEATPVEQPQLRHITSSANTQEFESPSGSERPPVRQRKTDDGDPSAFRSGRTPARIHIGDLSESAKHELKSLMGQSGGGKTVLPPILEVAFGEAFRHASMTDEGYFSKENSGHAPDDSSLRFTCDLDGRSFNRMSDLGRHRHGVHPNEHPPTWVFPCPVPGCVRGAQPFARKDKCIAHLRQRHPSDHLPILRVANPDEKTTTSCYNEASRIESIQPTSWNQRESHSSVSHQIRDKYQRSDHTLDGSTVASDAENDTSETSCDPFSSSSHLSKSQAPPIGLSSIDEWIEYRFKNKESQIGRYLNDVASDPANHRLVAFPGARQFVRGENLPFSSRTCEITTSSRGVKNGRTSTTHSKKRERPQKRPRMSSQAPSYQSIRPRADSVISSNGEYTETSQQGQDANVAGPEPSYVSPNFQGDEYFPSSRAVNQSGPPASDDGSFGNVLPPYQAQPSRRQPSSQPDPTIASVYSSHASQSNYHMDSATVPSYQQPVGVNPTENVTAPDNYLVHTPQQITSTSTTYAHGDPNPFIANSMLLPPQTSNHFAVPTSTSYHSTANQSPSSPSHYRRLSPQSLSHRHCRPRQHQTPDPLSPRICTPSGPSPSNPPLLSYDTANQYTLPFSQQDTIDPSFLSPTHSTASPHTAPSLTMTRSPSNNRSDPSSLAPSDPILFDLQDCDYGFECKLDDDVSYCGQIFQNESPSHPWGQYQGN